MNPLAAAIEELNQARQQRQQRRTSSAEPQPQAPESPSDDGGGERNIESLITGRDPNSRPRITRFGSAFDILIGAGRGGIQAVNETADLAAETGDTIEPAAAGIMPFGIGQALRGFSAFTRQFGLRKPDGEVADIPVPTEGEDTVTGRVSEAISQTIAGFYAGGRVLKAGQILQGGGRGIALARGLAAGGVGDFIAFDGNEERLSNLVEMVPQLRNPVTEYLAADEETPELLGRLKNTLEGAGVGLAFEAVLGVLRGTKALRRGDRAAVEAAVDEVEAASRTADEATLQAPPPATPPRDRVASAAAQAGEAMRPLRRPPAEVPETVMARDDVEAFLAEARANRPLSGQLNIKSGDIDGAAAKHGEWTLNTYGDPANLDATMRALVDRQGPAAPRSDTDLQSVALSAADELGMNPEEIMAAGYHIAGITGDIDTAVQTMRTLWARTARSVDDHVGKDLSQATDVEFATIVRDIHNAMVFGSYMARVKSAMGRGLRVFQLPDADTYAKTVAEGDDAPGALRRGPRDAAQLPATREEAADWLELWGFARTSGVPNPTEVLHVVPGEWKYLRTSFANAFTAGVLSAPKTIALNVIGPGILGALRTIERTVGGYPAALVESLKGNKERAAELMAAASRSATAYMQTSADIGLAFRWAVEAGKRGRLILGGHGSVTDNAAQFGPLTDNLLRAAGREPGFGYVFGNLLNLFPRAFAHLNIGLDEFARRLAYLGEARIRAMAEGETAGLKGADLDAFVKSKVAASTDEAGAAADEALLEAAERTTLTGTPGAAGGNVRKSALFINDLRRNVPETRFLLPIFNVPANSIGETLRRVPVLNTAFKQTRAELSGANGAVAQADAYGRTLLAAAFMWQGFMWARAGALTGAGPDNAADRKAWLGESESGAARHRPYSIRIGEAWFDYSKADVIGALLGIVATLYDRTVYRPQDRSAGDQILAGVAALSEYFRDRASLQTVSDLLSLGDRGQNIEAMAERFFGNAAGRVFVPAFVTALGRNTTDPHQRSRSSAIDYILNMIPGASRTLDPMRNVLGEPIHAPQDTLAENLLPITYAPISSYEDDPVLDELERLYSVTGAAIGVPSVSGIGGGYFEPREFMIGDRSLYDLIVQRRMTVTLDGLTLRQALRGLIDSPDYAEAVDADTTNRETSEGLVSRGYLLAQVFEEYHKAAKEEVARENPLAARALAVVRIKRVGGAHLADHRARDLIDDGGLLRALGISVEDYEATARGE